MYVAVVQSKCTQPSSSTVPSFLLAVNGALRIETALEIHMRTPS